MIYWGKKKKEKYPRDLMYSKRYLGYYLCGKNIFLWKGFKPLLLGI